jgi:hypothetical protein
MATRYFPDVASPAEHEALQRVVKYYPAYPYNEWLNVEAKKIADCRASGHEAKLVPITANEFTAYCDRTGALRDINTFAGVVFDKGRR